ncbi:MAG: ABC transporter permease [Lachnospiraceae bacterium]|nr:ABC transporter permease [Lachnospiraceae bacterium]
MRKLIQCELWKLKRKKFLILVIFSAVLFPIPLTVLMTAPQFAEQCDTKTQLFNEYFGYVMGYGVELLLPGVIGVLAAMLFFMERDNDTFKNLRTIPVTSTQMVWAKIIVLFMMGIAFSVSSALAAALCGSLVAEVNGMGYKLFVACELGVFITAGTLPLVVLVVFFSKTYIFSVLLCVFYSVFSLTAESLFGVLPKAAAWAMPIPLTTLWCASDMIKHGVRENVKQLEYLFPSTLQTAAIVGIMALASVAVIDYLYKRRGE